MSSAATDDGSDGEAATATAPTVLTWQGRIVADAGAGIPAHLDETAGLVRPVASEGFHLQIDQVPTDLQVTLSWTAPAAQLLLMVAEPDDAWPPVEYSVPHGIEFSDRSPLCARIPPEALKTGAWLIMVHPAVAVDAAVTFEVVMTGGAATIVDEPATVPVTVLPFAFKDKKTPQALPCDGGTPAGAARPW